MVQGVLLLYYCKLYIFFLLAKCHHHFEFPFSIKFYFLSVSTLHLLPDIFDSLRLVSAFVSLLCLTLRLEYKNCQFRQIYNKKIRPVWHIVGRGKGELFHYSKVIIILQNENMCVPTNVYVGKCGLDVRYFDSYFLVPLSFSRTLLLCDIIL